jgi:CBS domain-containing protein
MPIEHLARAAVVTAGQDAGIADLARLMQDENVGSVVITSGETPIGIVTDRDLTMRILAEEADPAGLTAEDVMSTNLSVVGPDAGFYQAAEVMSENGIRRLPVCDEDDELVGIITADDLSELLADEHQQMAAIVRAQRPEY